MNFAKIVALATLVLASTGCAIGSEDHELPTPQPAHEFSAPLNGPDQALERQPYDLSTMWSNVDTTPDPGTFRRPGEVTKPLINSPPIPNGGN